MNSILLSLSHKQLNWEDKWPPGFRGIGFPGSSRKSASGPFGSVCIQEFITEQWTIRFTIVDLVEKFTAQFLIDKPALYTSQQLKGTSTIKCNKHPGIMIRKSQVVISYSPSQLATVEWLPGLHVSFDMIMAEEMCKPMIHLFPGIYKIITLNNSWMTPATWADMESLDMIQSILRCPHPAEIYQPYFEVRVNDLLLNYLILSTKHKPVYPGPSAKEEQAITEIREFVGNNLTAHYYIGALARKAGMNEQRFKQLFKIMVGMGPYEFLLRKRMRKAKQMLLHGKSAKEVARHFGYRPSNFTHLFRNFFGYGPSDLPK